MIKDCVVLDGKIINIGPWDYQYKELGGKQVAQNPLPEGAVVEGRDIVNAPDGGLIEAGTYVDFDQELVTAISAATTVEELKSALLGGMRAGRVKGRPI